MPGVTSPFAWMDSCNGRSDRRDRKTLQPRAAKLALGITLPQQRLPSASAAVEPDPNVVARHHHRHGEGTPASPSQGWFDPLERTAQDNPRAFHPGRLDRIPGDTPRGLREGRGAKQGRHRLDQRPCQRPQLRPAQAALDPGSPSKPGAGPLDPDRRDTALPGCCVAEAAQPTVQQNDGCGHTPELPLEMLQAPQAPEALGPSVDAA